MTFKNQISKNKEFDNFIVMYFQFYSLFSSLKTH